jgi:NAD(P)-dependent dehydrogenase (short-subunit alcohol dehydrogenase family)
LGVPLLEAEGVAKSFSGVPALKDGRLTLEAGSVHALCGGNGAGKSTFLNVMMGILRRDAGMTKVLAMEWARYGITVNAVSPTVVETELGKKAWAGEVGEAMKKKIPVGRFGQPEEIAAAVLYLISGVSGMITGENLVIDGGYTIQ